ncbi:uncharacterized protein LOC110449401 [Mizuhopecten yessoensis]|uniref:Uncharacterized protein n=1 Tax=Mizuhopecten yessoensis TaxID=6573 RepID=A0A210QRB2_MIZYE|nr:uncharacterized protein LOC110449401 [Mizuhopecten yessoensis]OWF51274.1 hypothetical protein KP79_PYT24248 [Mizuhopecten yessoensis]
MEKAIPLWISLMFGTMVARAEGSTRQQNFNTMERCAAQFDNLSENRRRNVAVQLEDIYNVLTDLVNNADEEIAQYNAIDEQWISLAPWNVLQITPDDTSDVFNVTSQLRNVSTVLTRLRSREQSDSCVSSVRMNREERRTLTRRWLLRWKPRRSQRRFDGTHARQVQYLNLCATELCHINGFAVLPNGHLVASDSDNYDIYIYKPGQDYPMKTINLAPLYLGEVIYSHDWIVRIHVRLINQQMAWLVLNLLDSTSYLEESIDQSSLRWDVNEMCITTDAETEPETRIEPCADPGYLAVRTTDEFGFTYGASHTEFLDAIAPNCTRYPSITRGRYDYIVRHIVRFDRNMLYVRTDSRGSRKSSVNNLHIFEMFNLIDSVT